jgi:hypothetical protein
VVEVERERVDRGVEVEAGGDPRDQSVGARRVAEQEVAQRLVGAERAAGVEPAVAAEVVADRPEVGALVLPRPVELALLRGVGVGRGGDDAIHEAARVDLRVVVLGRRRRHDRELLPGAVAPAEELAQARLARRLDAPGDLGDHGVALLRRRGVEGAAAVVELARRGVALGAGGRRRDGGGGRRRSGRRGGGSVLQREHEGERPGVGQQSGLLASNAAARASVRSNRERVPRPPRTHRRTFPDMAKPLRSPRSDDREMNGAAPRTVDEGRGHGDEQGREHVVLVHGLLRTPRSWITVRRHLERSGFSTGVFGYSSLSGALEPHGRALSAELRRLDARGDDTRGRDTRGRWARVHLVGHSLGNLVIRAALALGRPKNLGRVVMLVPPNQGSAVARRLAPLLGDLFPVLRDLSDADGSAARRLAFPPMEAGVIAARFDYVVAESSTHVPGEADHLLVGASHGWLMFRPSVQRAIVAFLRTGRFPRPSPPPPKSRRREERSSR